MLNAKDWNPADHGLTLQLISPPKVGKSHMARSARKLGPTVALLAQHELASYAGEDIEYQLVYDDEWDSYDRSFGAKAFQRARGQLKEWAKRDDIKTLIIDTFDKGVGEALWRDIMSFWKTDDPRTLGGDARTPYASYSRQLADFMDHLDLIRFRKHWNVIMCFHEDVREAKGVGVPRKEQEKTASGFKTAIHYDEMKLPEVIGSSRQSIGGWFDVIAHVEAVTNSNPYRAKLLFKADATHQAGTRLKIMQELEKMTPDVPNDFPKLIELVRKVYGPTQKVASIQA